MDYLSVAEVAAKWGISTRQVQRLLADQRIPGARKHGRAWMIPADAEKPGDLRSVEKDFAPQAAIRVLPLICSAFEPGQCRQVIEAMEDEDLRQIAWAEYYYFSAQPQKVQEITKKYLVHEEIGIRLSALLLYIFTALPQGKIAEARSCIGEIHILCRSMEQKPVSSVLKGTVLLIALTSAVLLHMDHSAIPSITPYLRYLPDGLKMFGYYVCAHAVYLRGDYGEALGIAKTALNIHFGKHVIAEIYLRLVMAMSLMSLKRTSEARECFMEAWELAGPDGLLEGFGEHHGLLQGLIESCLKRTCPQEYEKVINITYSFSAGWRKVHNPVMNKSVADNLTTMEFSVAMLADRGWTNVEIADYLNLSEHTVKKYLSDVYQKLGVTSRKELHQYMLK